MDTPLHILIVEDNPLDYLLLKEYISMSGLVVRSIEKTERVDSSLEKLSFNFDIIFLDLFLPDSSGLDTFQTVHAVAPDIPIVILSGLADAEMALRAIQSGAQDYLIKGEFNESVIFKTVHYSINRKLLEKKVIQAQEALALEQVMHQQLITEATIQAQEKEREQLGAELHDNINQMLASCRMCLDMGMREDELKEELMAKAHKMLGEAIEELRKLSKTLVPPALTDIGLEEALKELTNTLNLYNKTRFDLMFNYTEQVDLPNHKELMVYRIVQEQTNNIIKYANASKAVIKLTISGPTLLIDITDNGIGFDTQKKSEGIGLRNIKSRAQLYKGHVQVISGPGTGCRLSVSIPI